MCGILGTVNKPFDNSILDLIKHRGPDDSEILNLIIADSKITLGHRRLSIQDLTNAGHQPMYSACRKFVIIFNGEIYNHPDLRGKLPDIKFKGHSDTETIINYIAKYGIESVKDFNGIFGLSVLDIENQKLYLVRDRYGVKPVYYYKDNNSLIYCSEIRPVKELINTAINKNINIDKNNLAALLKLRYNPAPLTLYENIQKLRAGHILACDLKTNDIELSSFITPVMTNKTIPFDQALLKYGKLFEQAVKRQLLADVEPGVLLSGGIDSALVAFFAQKYSNKPIKTFTIGFEDDDDSDETNEAGESARILGTDHYEIKITDHQFEDVFEKCINIVEEPLGTTSLIPMYFLNQLASRHVKVVLTGQGADEPLGGYKRYQGDILHKKVHSILFKILKPFSGLIKNESIYRAANSLGEKDPIKRFELIYSLFNQDEIKKLVKTDESKSNDLIKYFYELLSGKDKDSTNAMMSNDIRMNLCDDLLLYTDKISMNFSMEARVPVLDNDLTDFTESLPVEYKIKGKEGKYIHKKFAESVLPEQIVYRKKKGFKSPTEKWFKGEKGLMYKNMLISNNSKFAQFFDIKETAKIFDTHKQGKRNMEKQLFTLISIYYWMENYELQNNK